MENKYKAELIKEALFLFDQKTPVFISQPVTQVKIGNCSEYDPISDREVLIRMCEENPTANLEVSLLKEFGLIALGVGVGFWKEKGNESFQKLTEKYGVPDTLAYQISSEEKYYLFRPGNETLTFEPESGLRFMDSGRSYVYPSLVDGQQVIRIGNATTVANWDDWIAGNAQVSAPPSNATEEPQDSGPENEPIEQVPLELSGPGETAEAMEPEVSIPVEAKRDGTAIAVEDPTSELRKEITAWIAKGSDKNTILTQALEWNSKKGSPIKVEVIVSMLEELGEITTNDVEALSGEELLFQLAEDTILFHDDLSEPYFFCEGEHFKAPSKDYGSKLQYRYYTRTKAMPAKKFLNNVLAIMEMRAKHEGQRVGLKNRVSGKDKAFIYDLRDKRYIKTTAKGWEIIPAYPLFRRYNHQQPQVEPIPGGDPWEVFNFLTVSEESRLLIMVYIISLFVARIAHPVFAVFGDQGSAKSFFCTVINRLVDPTLTERIIQPKNERDLIQTLRQKYVTVLDNLSNINDRVSDIFCQVCTGGGISFRKLYTDEGENIAQFLHVVILNSISLAIVNADLMDRSIILKCNRIKPEDRKPEDELWDAFEIARPRILGGIFDTLVRAMAIYPTINIEKLPRLADFAKWGYAIAEALGRNGNQFLEDFSQNVKRQNESVADKNVLCQIVIQLMSDKDVYLKSVGDAHNALKNLAREDAKDATFPKLPNHLRGGLEKLRSTLAEHNITFQFFDRNNKGVQVLFTKTASQATLTPEPAVTETNIGVPGDPGVALGAIPVVEFDEEPEVDNA
jgi:hypothetical protein